MCRSSMSEYLKLVPFPVVSSFLPVFTSGFACFSLVGIRLKAYRALFKVLSRLLRAVIALFMSNLLTADQFGISLTHGNGANMDAPKDVSRMN